MKDLREFLSALRARKLLVEVDVPVDPVHEMTEIACRLVKEGGPAVLFTKPVGSTTPVFLNGLGTPERMEIALGRSPQEVAAEIGNFLHEAIPPKPSTLFKHRALLWRGTKMRLKELRSGPCQDNIGKPALNELPVLTCWPEDGGRFITWPLVVTRHPELGDDNLGLYRMQVHADDETGMHWQIAKGGGFHHHAAERLSQDLPCAVAIGADPLTMLAGMLPLPEGLSELAFAGFLRGQPTEVVRTRAGLPVPAHSEIVLEGVVPAGVRRNEGPFGDHFGHYSSAADFPVFRVDRVWQRKDAIYVAAVVGKPPQEDKVLGETVQDMFLPLLAFTRPELRDAWAFQETGFHALFAVSMRPRYEKESLKTALSLLGEGQVSLTKVLAVVPHEVDCRDALAILDALGERFVPSRDVQILASTSADTLDFTGPRLNHGSKMILDLTGPPHPRPDLSALPDLVAENEDVLEQRLVAGSTLLLRLRQGADGDRRVGACLEDPRLADLPLLVALSADADLEDQESWLWAWFTRFDPAADVRFRRTRLAGSVAVHEGTMGIDATWKQGYPEPLEMPTEVVQRVDERWKSYGL